MLMTMQDDFGGGRDLPVLILVFEVRGRTCQTDL